nr:hypothetical protein BaRGS_005304 [Batillaria attramentaria]
MKGGNLLLFVQEAYHVGEAARLKKVKVNAPEGKFLRKEFWTNLSREVQLVALGEVDDGLEGTYISREVHRDVRLTPQTVTGRVDTGGDIFLLNGETTSLSVELDFLCELSSIVDRYVFIAIFPRE